MNFSFKELEEINLFQNSLKELKLFNHFEKLTTLNLSANKIKPQSLLDLPSSIKSLNISKNQIRSMTFNKNNTQIPILKTLINLEVIDVSFNNLEKIEEKCFDCNTSLQVKNRKIRNN